VGSKAAEAMDAEGGDFPKLTFPAGPGASAHRQEPVGQEGFLFDRNLEDELERGEKLAQLYLTEREERPADHPLTRAREYNREVGENNERTEKRARELREEKQKKLEEARS
jgi:hypothetical protein